MLRPDPTARGAATLCTAHRTPSPGTGARSLPVLTAAPRLSSLTARCEWRPAGRASAVRTVTVSVCLPVPAARRQQRWRPSGTRSTGPALAAAGRRRRRPAVRPGTGPEPQHHPQPETGSFKRLQTDHPPPAARDRPLQTATDRPPVTRSPRPASPNGYRQTTRLHRCESSSTMLQKVKYLI